jgi:hypothetical protein
MRGELARLLLLAGVAVTLFACTSSPPVSRHAPTPPATAKPSPVATPARSGAPVLTALSGADQTTLAEVYITYTDSEPGHAGLFTPGSIGVARSSAALMPDGGEWAYGVMRLKPGTTRDRQATGSPTGRRQRRRLPQGIPGLDVAAAWHRRRTALQLDAPNRGPGGGPCALGHTPALPPVRARGCRRGSGPAEWHGVRNVSARLPESGGAAGAHVRRFANSRGVTRAGV